jgi:hypothetical protein
MLCYVHGSNTVMRYNNDKYGNMNEVWKKEESEIFMFL